MLVPEKPNWITLWNNLKLNRAKSTEIIFEKRRRKTTSSPLIPPPLPDIHRVSQVKILGITVTNHLSVSDHVRHVICKCGQSMSSKCSVIMALCDSALGDVYRAVVIAKLLDASPACRWGYASTSDKQRIDALVCGRFVAQRREGWRRWACVAQ